MDALRFVGVDFAYPGGPPLLRGIDLAVPRGSLVVLAGRSGSGKSSLLSIAAGLHAPRAGHVEVLGRRLPPPGEAAKVRARHIGLVFQHLNLLEELNVAENIALPLRLHHAPKGEQERTVRELAHRFGLEDLLRRLPGSLSGGEQQRVAIARALAPRPAVLLVDEPTSALDRDNAQQVIDALEAAAAAGAGVLVAAHDELFTGRDHVHLLQAGRIVEGARVA